MNEVSSKPNLRLWGLVGGLAMIAVLSFGVLAGSLFTRPVAAAAQSTDPAHSITVAGVGEVSIKPDTATLNFQIHLLGATSDEALAAYEQAANALAAKLKELGLADSEIIVQSASTWPVQPQPMDTQSPESATSSGYYADGAITAKVNDLSKLRDIAMEGLRSSEGIGLSMIGYGLKDDAAARNDAMNKAIDNARSQADAVAAKLGLTVKEVSGVTVNASYTNSMPYGGKAAEAAMGSSNGANFTDLGTRPDIVVNATVQVSYNFE